MPHSWFSENKIVANSVALTPEIFYVYKVSLNTGHFYIGQTGDISSRLAQHIRAIHDFNYEDTSVRLQFHATGYELLMDKFGNEIKSIKDVKKFMSVHIIAMTDSRKYALLIEREAISDSKSNPMCLNK